MPTTITRPVNQVSMVDRAAANPSRVNPGGASSVGARYSPLNAPNGANAHEPAFEEDSDGRLWMFLQHDDNTANGIARNNYSFWNPTEIAGWIGQRQKIAIEFEMKLDGVTDVNNIILWKLVGRDNSNGTGGTLYENTWRQRATLTDMRASTGGSVTNTTIASTQLSSANQTYTFRIIWRASTGASDGVLTIYVAPGSITDRDILAGGDLTFVQEINITNADMQWLEGIGFQYNPTNVGHDDNTTSAGARYRCLWYGDPDDLPTTVTDGSASWFDMHRNVIEKFMAFQPSDGLYAVRATAIVHHGVTPCDTDLDISLKIYSSEADYLTHAGGGADNSINTVTSSAVAQTSEGFFRTTIQSGSVLTEGTPYVFAFVVAATDAAYNGASQYTFFSKPGFVGNLGALPRFEIASCAHTTYTNNLSDQNASRERAIAGPDSSNRPRVLMFLGDETYMDEVDYSDKAGDWSLDSSGVADETADREGAETLQQMADELTMNRHAFAKLEEARFFHRHVVRDDHCGGVNDGPIADLLLEDRLTNGGGVQICPWRKRGAGNTNSRYGFPICIEWGDDTVSPDIQEYGLPPRTIANNVLQHNREWTLDHIPPVSSGLRFDPSGVNKYGATAYDQDDSGYYYTDLGQLRILMLDTRASFTHSTDFNPGTYTGTHTPSFFTYAQSWIEAAIAGCTKPGLVIGIPGYIEGYASGGTAKRNDNIGVYIQDGNATVLAEAVSIFKTALDANPAINWVAIFVGDHHYCTLDRTVIGSYSSKLTMQLADGAAHSIVQDPDDLGDIEAGEDYVYATAFGLTAGGIMSRTMFDLIDAQTGQGTVTLHNVSGPTPSEFGTYAISGISGNATRLARTDRDRRVGSRPSLM